MSANLDTITASQHAHLVGLIRKRVRSHHDAQDIVQDAYLHLLEKDALIEHPFSYLRSASRNLATNAQVQRRIRWQLHYRAVPADNLIDKCTPDVQAEADELMRAYERAVLRFMPQQRHLFDLVFLRNVGLPEAAKQIGMHYRMAYRLVKSFRAKVFA